MTDELADIIKRKDKLALDKYAEVRGVMLDRRKSFPKMLSDWEAEMANDAEEAPEPNEPDIEQPAEDEPAHEPAIEVPAEEPSTIPLADIEAMAREWADTFANDINSVSAMCHGMVLEVSITTRHGVSVGSAPLDKWTRANVKAALKDIQADIG